MKKVIALVSILLACFSLATICNSQTVSASSRFGWHHGHYYVEDEDGQPMMDKIDVVGKYLIDRDGNRHKLNLSKRGNHTRAARRVARVVANACKKRPGDSDLSRVDMAAYYVSQFSARDRYTMKGRYYDTAYGVFIAKQYSCAGSTAALQMVLRQMGFKARHVNKGKYTHQWCTLKMDGRRGYADGQSGFANYGKYFTKKNTWIETPENSIVNKKWQGIL